MKMKVPFSIMHDVSVFQLWEIFEKVEFYGLGLTGLMLTYQLVRVLLYCSDVRGRFGPFVVR